MKYKIAVITPKNKNDYLTDTVIDGLLSFNDPSIQIEFYIPNSYPTELDKSGIGLSLDSFVNFARNADLILFMKGKDGIKKNFFLFTLTQNNTDYETANEINLFKKTIFIDGSELGGDKRYNAEIRKDLIEGKYEGRGAVDTQMEKKCAMYFKREKPYLRSIVPFPFGIETDYTRHYETNKEKDIDFFCVFGYEDYAPLRKQVREYLVEFCQKNNFTYFTEKTPKDNFYKMLARSKVGISVGGGGFDTARFWEILGNNCLLLTEKIDIYEEYSRQLNYDRIWQFETLDEFKTQLQKMGEFLRNTYKKEDLEPEYQKIITEHSSKSRVLEIIEKAKEKGIIE